MFSFLLHASPPHIFWETRNSAFTEILAYFMDVQSWSTLFGCEIAVELAKSPLFSLIFKDFCCCFKLKREAVKIISQMENVVKEIMYLLTESEGPDGD